MIYRTVPVIASLSLVLALGACGGGDTGTTDAVVDPAATEPTAGEPTAASDPALTEPSLDEPAGTEPVATETLEPGEEPAMAVTDGSTEALEMESAATVEDGWSAMQADWQSSAGRVKDQWSELTEAEILETGGDREQLVGLVQEKYGIERGQAEREVSAWVESL